MYMKVTATHRHARMAPRKIRPLARLLRGLSVEEAAVQLQFLPGKAPEIIQNVLKSAVANSQHNYDLESESLRVVEVRVDEGIVMKRFQPVAKGMAHPILKRTSHVTVVVEGEAADKKKVKKASKKANIETVSVDEYEVQRAEARQEEAEAQEVAEKELSKGSTETRPIEERESKQNYEVRQKKVALQQGGDKKKSPRRVSKKGNS